MKMKHLFRYTSTLLRTALLLGALSFFDIATHGQTAEELAAMPNAFETIEDPNSVIGNGEYYYIQFYYNGPISYLNDCGVSKKALASDFLPSNNRLWTLESAGNGQFKLKCKDGNYLGFGRFDGQDRYGGVVNSEDAIVFTFGQFNGGYYIKRAASDHVLYRNNNAEWADFPYGDGRDSQKYSGHMRIVKLKSNAAYIIYYRQDGADNSDPSASTIRHYLTYSDVDATSTVMASAVTNGSLEGADASSFFFGDPDHNERLVASITDGAGNNGSRGIQITARGKDDPQDWDTQFFISADEVIPEGTTFHLEFDYRASRNATVPTQAHAEPGNYIDWAMLGNLNFTTDWQTYSADIEVTHNMGYGRDDDKGNSFQTIAFNLWRERSTDPNTIYYFDNIKLTVPTSGSAVSSRRSIIPPDKPLYTLPTIAAYHQDGLWQLEEASADGKFYIKKYDSNEYLNCDLADPYAAAFAVLGPKDETHGQYSLVDPVASRYTLVQNVQYQTAALSPDMFYHWDGYGADAEIDGQHGNVDFFFQLGQQLNSGDVVAGTGGVDYVRYANLTGYTTMIFKGTPGMVVRVLMNRQESNSGPLTERALTIGNDGKVELDLTDIKNDAGYVHLNAIKIGWGNSGIINDVELVNQNQVNNSSPLYLNHSNGDGYPVMQRNDDADNHWYAAFYPVEVPVPNKDDFFQVLVRWGDNMIDHNGGASPLPADVSDYDLWQLEQVDDYLHFRLKDPTGRYLRPWPDGMTEPNNPEGAEINTNEKFWTDFALTWYYINPVPKEIRVNHYVTHRESYLRTYADDKVITDQEGLRLQGLARDIDSDWKNVDNDSGVLGGFTQNTNHFVITHYIKKGNSKVIEFPTVLNRNNDHIQFQRFYNYDEVDTGANGTGMDLDKLKAHVSLDTRDDGDVQYFLYNNGMVTGQKLKWQTYNNGTYTDIPDGGMARNAQRRFNFTNSDGERFTVGVDVSRYSDLKYENTTDYQADDLKEPSLTMRYLFQMRDAKEMAADLTANTEGSDNWLEDKVFHFGRTQVPYTKFKKVGYRGEFIPIRHVFSDYWVFDDPDLVDEYKAALAAGTDVSYLDQHLVSAVNDNNGGKIEVVIEDPNGLKIRRGGYNADLRSTLTNGLNNQDYDDSNETEEEEDKYQCFYFYDLLSPNVKYEYGNSRFIVFRYPANGIVPVADDKKESDPAYIKVYLNHNGTRYQIAKFTLIFDKNMATRPWTEIKNGTVYANGVNKVKNTSRDPRSLRAQAGHPIAKITFDFPKKMILSGDSVDATYHYPSVYDSQSTDGVTRHDGGNYNPGGTITYTHTVDNTEITEYSSPVPLTFGHTNYAFDGDGANWGSYALVTGKRTTWGNDKIVEPADDETYGYNLPADEGMQKAFLYIDASEQPGDICSVDFEGEFCANDNLMCSGWISGSNKIQNDTRCPGSITLTVKGGNADGSNTNTIYRFCPGQIYELDNGYGDNGEGNATAAQDAAGIDGNGNGATHVVWQQFYFEFSTDKKYERYWLEVNNNCVSSNGGDFMIDNVEVYTIVPEVIPEINTPLCVNSDGTTDMRLLKLDVDYNKLKSSVKTTGKTKLGFVFLEKDVFLNTLMNLKNLESTYPTLDDFAVAIKEGNYLLSSSDPDYIAAFNAALLGNQDVWNSNNRTEKMGSGVMLFEWDTVFEQNELYSFGKAVNKLEAVFREIDTKGTDDTSDDVYNLVFNGNYPELPWKAETEYYIVPANIRNNISFSDAYSLFNICSECSKASVFKIKRPYSLLGLDSSETTNDYVVCEGQIPTIVLNLKGYTLDEKEVDLNNLNFDWWLGKKGDNTTNPVTPPVLATLENYHDQDNGNGVKLDVALSTLRIYFPEATSLDGISQQIQQNPHPALTLEMVEYLQSLVDAGQLVLHQTSVNVPAEKASDEDPYFYIVACPIHDEMYRQALNPNKNEYVAYYCDEPQGLRIKVGQKAPRLQTGFVPGEHGFQTYNYNFPANTNPVLSIRLAKAAQFETVKNTEAEVANETDTNGNVISYNINEDVNYLWLPIRNAQTEGAYGVIKKAKDDNVYLASSNDPTWDKKISKEMNKNGLLPVVGRIAQLQAIDTKNNASANQNGYNRLSVYFVKNFNVREGYNYTLSLPFQEDDNSNACDGTILINLKIVPDYEVWTGAAGNIDWNNDENWRRADGNTTISNTYYGDELYRANGAVGNEYSPLHEYVTNKDNYYSSSKKANAKPSKDQILRKGFAPLYCTHVLIKNDEWGNAPELYDALDYHAEDAEHKLNDAPFPNLRETSTPILKFDMQARSYDLWKETYGTDPDRGRSNHPDDLIAEMYQINSCDEIAFQPGTELRNGHLLNYNTAWMEYQLDNKRWYLLGSPLQGTISGEWYAPTGTAQQKTTYYDPVEFGTGYDRYSPAIYQRSWDKAKAVLYEVGSTYSTTDDSQTTNLGTEEEGQWENEGTEQAPDWQWNVEGGGTADEYLDRLGYKPMGGKKANVAIKGIWSNTYNDATVDYATGGFSVMVMNHLKNNDQSNDKSIVRLPKEDTMYDYYGFDRDGADNPDSYEDIGTNTQLSDVRTLNRAKNRGRLKTDLLLPELLDGSLLPIIQKVEKTVSRYGDKRTYTRIPIKEGDLQNMNYSFLPTVSDGGTLQTPSAGHFTETIAPGISHLGFYLIENPFPCGLDMNAFFMVNEDILESKYWLLTATGQHLVQRAADGDWITPDKDAFEYPNPDASVQDDTQSDTPVQDDTEPDATLTFSPHAVLAPGQGFFVKAKSATDQSITVTFNKDMQVQSRFGEKDNENGTTFTIVVGQSQRTNLMYDSDNDGIPDTEVDPEEHVEGDLIMIDTDNDGTGDTPTPVLAVPVFVVDSNGDYVLDAEGNKQPVLDDIEQDVVIYKYKKATLKLSDESTTDMEYPLLSRQTRGGALSSLSGLVITAKRGNDKSSALVMQRDGASNDFLPSEDTETFILGGDLLSSTMPTVYTLCGRLATTINSIHDFRSLPLGVESASEAPCTLTFDGVEFLGDSISFYDAVERTLTPLVSGMQFKVSGQTQNRYYLVRSLIQEEAAAETHLQIFTEGLTAKVIASTAEPILNVRCYDTAGRLVHAASPQTTEYSFTLPSEGVYIIDAQTESDRKTKKVMTR